MGKPGEPGGCGNIGVGVRGVVCSLNLEYSLEVTGGHSKAINMDCGLAVVSPPESWCPQETTGIDYLSHDFPEMAKLASFSIQFQRCA